MILLKTWKKTQLCHQQCWKVKTGGSATNANCKLREEKKEKEGEILFSDFSTNKNSAKKQTLLLAFVGDFFWGRSGVSVGEGVGTPQCCQFL